MSSSDIMGGVGPTTNLYAFVNGQPEGGDGHCAMVLSDRGDFLFEHVVENIEDAPYFVGIGSEVHHDIYKDYAPEGWTLVFVTEPLEHADVQAAYALHKAKAETATVIKPAPVVVH